MGGGFRQGRFGEQETDREADQSRRIQGGHFRRPCGVVEGLDDGNEADEDDGECYPLLPGKEDKLRNPVRLLFRLRYRFNGAPHLLPGRLPHRVCLVGAASGPLPWEKVVSRLSELLTM